MGCITSKQYNHDEIHELHVSNLSPQPSNETLGTASTTPAHTRTNGTSGSHSVDELQKVRDQTRSIRAKAKERQLQQIKAKIESLTQEPSNLAVINRSPGSTNPPSNTGSVRSNGHNSTHGHDVVGEAGEGQPTPSSIAGATPSPVSRAAIQEADQHPGNAYKTGASLTKAEEEALKEFLQSYRETRHVSGTVEPGARMEDYAVEVIMDSYKSLQQSDIASSGAASCRDDYFDDHEKELFEKPRPKPMALDNQSSFSWRQGELLGCGAYGSVHLGLNLNTGQLMAVKQVPIEDGILRAGMQDPRIISLQKEIQMLGSLANEHIVGYLGMEYANNQINIFLEFVPGGSIASLLKKFGSFNETLVRVYTRQILLGLAYLHAHQIVHRDIKGGNILVDINGTCKLADFGASSRLADIAGERPAIQGTPYWMAPEVIRQQGHGRKVDIWSVGCTVLEMFTGRPPWSEFQSHAAVLYHIASTADPPAMPDDLSEEGRDFVLKCLERDPKKRPNAWHLLQHPFVNSNPTNSRNVTPAPSRHISPGSSRKSSLASGIGPDSPSRLPLSPVKRSPSSGSDAMANSAGNLSQHMRDPDEVKTAYSRTAAEKSAHVQIAGESTPGKSDRFKRPTPDLSPVLPKKVSTEPLTAESRRDKVETEFRSQNSIEPCAPPKKVAQQDSRARSAAPPAAGAQRPTDYNPHFATIHLELAAQAAANFQESSVRTAPEAPRVKRVDSIERAARAFVALPVDDEEIACDGDTKDPLLVDPPLDNDADNGPTVAQAASEKVIRDYLSAQVERVLGSVKSLQAKSE